MADQPAQPNPSTPAEGTYARQDSLKLKIPARIGIIGCGGVGSWLAYFLALAGAKELWLWDSDKVSDHNLNRLPLTRDAIGKNKSEALAALIEAARPECEVYAMGHFSADQAEASGFATLSELAGGRVWVCATTDTLASRKMVYDWAKSYGHLYLEASAEGEIGSITGEPAGWATEEETKPGYASVPVWVGPCVLAASLACAHILHSTKLGDESIRIGWTPTGIVWYNSAQHPTSASSSTTTKHDHIRGIRRTNPSTGRTYIIGCSCDECVDIFGSNYAGSGRYNSYGHRLTTPQ